MSEIRSTDLDVAEEWRAGCECNRAGLCYRCQAASEIGKLRDLLRRSLNEAFEYHDGRHASRCAICKLYCDIEERLR